MNKVVICGVDTSALPTLGQKEMRQLLEQTKAGNKAARERLVNGNLRLVLSVIQRFLGRGENPDDLFQVGCIGLMKGLDNFDLSLNVRLSTYCVPMIIGEIRRYLRDNNPIRVSRSMRDTAYRALKARDALSGDAGRDRGRALRRRMESQLPFGDVDLYSKGAEDVHAHQAGHPLPHLVGDVVRAGPREGRRDAVLPAAEADPAEFMEAHGAAGVHQQQSLAAVDEDVAAGQTDVVFVRVHISQYCHLSFF